MRTLSIKWYLAAVSALGVAMLVTCWAARPVVFSSSTAIFAAAFALLMALAGVFPIPLSPKVKANVVTAPAFAAVLLFSPALAVSAATAGTVISELVLRRKPRYVLFNTAAAAFSVGGAALVHSTILRGGPLYAWPSGVVAAFVAAGAMYATNRLAVAQAAASQTQENALRLWRSIWRQDVLVELSLFCLGFASSIAIRFVPAAVILMVVPVAAIYLALARAASLNARLEERMRELQATQAQLVETAKMASLGTLTAGIGHQINNPIFVIKGRSDLLLEGADRHLRTEKARQHLELIRDMADRVGRIVSCMLTSNRDTGNARQGTDLNDAVETVLSLLNDKIAKCRIMVMRDLQAGLPPAYGAAIEVQETLGNMVSNACDAMCGGGQLTIRTWTTGLTVGVSVADTGTGISRADLSRIFDPFYTTKETSGGIGLGLYVAKNTVEKYGGRIEVESVPGQGSMFTVYLPATSAPTEAPAARERGAPEMLPHPATAKQAQ